jgi:hypothetical protein
MGCQAALPRRSNSQFDFCVMPESAVSFQKGH